MRGWLLVRFAGLDVQAQVIAHDDQSRQELLLLSPSILVPCLTHEGVKVWDTLAIGEYLNETCPKAGLLPADRVARAHCRAIAGEMHAGFSSLRAALPMNLRAHHESFRIFAGARPDIERIETIWRECLSRYGGPFLFGERPTTADAMYAPVTRRFITYAVAIAPESAAYCDTIDGWAPMQEWVRAALAEPEEMEELEVEF